MNCEQVQPNLLDYARKLLKGSEYEEIRDHLASCAECAAVLKEEIEFSQRLSSMPDEQPCHDVWALVRSRTRPKRVRPLVWLHSLVSTGIRRAATATVAIGLVGFAFYSMNTVTTTATAHKPETGTRPPVVAVYSDDPLGGHTDAVIDSIDDM